MSSKLTLSINAQVIASAKEFAQRQGTSLSALVENYLKSLELKNQAGSAPGSMKLSPTVAALKGSVKPDRNFDDDYKKVINRYRAEKWENQ